MPPSHRTGPEFEDRARNVARAIHDPLGTQGAVMVQGREHDSIFISADAIHAYEFTEQAKKDKAQYDAAKIADALKHLHQKSEYQYHACTGWFVTKSEPTADQRAAVNEVVKRTGIRINAISYMTLQGRICDADGYLKRRDNAPFGSTVYTVGDIHSKEVAPEFHAKGGTLKVRDIADKLQAGEHVILVGEFGVGKSFAMRELYRTLRARYYRSKGLDPFPLHINLRDCAGLKTPAEVLRRHAEEIGFPSDRSLISAWRAGSCILLLDGFDEIVPTRWLGSVSDLRQVRYESLSQIRRMIDEAPEAAGIAVCGRSHFFSTPKEMNEALGLPPTLAPLRIEDFSEEQLQEFLKDSGVTSQLPDWLPTRPLLIGYLLARQSLGEVGIADFADQAEAWRALFDLICRRETKMLRSVRPETIRQIISRVATLARASGDHLGPIKMNQVERAYVQINGVQPDEEGIQLLLRLPGLASTGGEAGGWEGRMFVDRNLAETAYGEDLASYLLNPFGSHELAQSSSWTAAASQLGIDVASRALEDLGLGAGTVLAAGTRRLNDGQYDAVLSDTIRVADSLTPDRPRQNFLVEGVFLDYLAPGEGQPVLAQSTLQGCFIETLDLGSLEKAEDCPSFQSCLIGQVEGVTAIPDWLSGKFTDPEIDNYSDHLQTTAGIMQLALPPEMKIAITVLKKIYSQRGTGRKEGALSRGLEPRLRQFVPQVVADLVSDGWITSASRGAETIYLPVKNRRAQALQALDNPSTFRLRHSTP